MVNNSININKTKRLLPPHMSGDKESLKIPIGNQNPYIEEQTTQWPNEKVQNYKHRILIYGEN